jgi:hypothetical protein
MANDNSDMERDESLIYFAARSPERTATALLAKGSTFFNVLQSNMYLTKLNDMWRFYYGHFNDDSMTGGHEISFTGEQGELVRFPVNLFRNLARHLLSMMTANRPILEARAVNSDYKSLSQTYLANGILDYYMREKGLEDKVTDAVEMSIVLGSAYVKMEWNATAGEIHDANDQGDPEYEGELEFSLLTPLDVIVDGTKENWDSHEWVLARSFINRYNLIAKYPEVADRIIQMETKNGMSNHRLTIFSNDDTDDIPVFEFYHKKTEAMPNGRYMLFIAEDIVLLDLPLPYRTIPIFRLCPSHIMGTPYGYSDMFDVFPMQQALNSMHSAIMTNQNAFNVQNLFVQRGSDLTVSSLAGGLNIVEGNSAPQALQLTATAPETFNYLSIISQAMESQVGVSSVTRGAPEASLRSGNALALVQSMSLQFQSPFQKNYVKFLEKVGTSLIEILKQYATTPKLISLVGKNKKPLLKEFTGDMIGDIKRVIVDVGNPLSRTTAGKLEIANNLLQQGAITNPKHYFMVLETGNIDTMVEGEMADLLLIQSENEWLMEGREVYADPLDQHTLHIMEHRAVISDPELRRNPELTKKVHDHIQEHIDMLKNVSPDLLQLIGQQPLQPTPDAAASGQLPPGPMNPQDPSAAGGGAVAPLDPASMDPSQMGPQVSNASMPGMPSVDPALLPDPSLDPLAGA